jgi:hypothetical protein
MEFSLMAKIMQVLELKIATLAIMLRVLISTDLFNQQIGPVLLMAVLIR